LETVSIPPSTLLTTAQRTPDGLIAIAPVEETPQYAFIGVRACDLNAIAVQDRTFLGGPYIDPNYKARRDAAFIVAVNCGYAASTCFCVSMNAGPLVKTGYDIALTEILEDDRHEFLVEAASERGEQIVAELPGRAATRDDISAAHRAVEHAAQNMGRTMETEGIKELLYRNLDHPRWENVAARCLSCANCTMVCPTCFCSTVEEATDITGDHTERCRRWDSCFTADHSYIHGGVVRSTTLARYRQWMTHKLATWIDQFQTSGCVGCGRCITWCPSTTTAAVSTVRSRIVGTPNGRCLPSGLGIYTRHTGRGRYVRLLSSSASSSNHRSTPYSSMSSKL
jgi:sulfhydrogenase subunit beta (sulfur reductase)